MCEDDCSRVQPTIMTITVRTRILARAVYLPRVGSPDVSVVIPTYNRAHLIARTIDCVLDQTYPHCHVIVSDDGSRDDTRDVIARRYGSNARVLYLHQENRGVSAARNFALKHVKGEYVAYLDSDDLWKPWKLEAQVACLEKLRDKNVEMLWTDMDLVDPDDRVTTPSAIRTSYSAYRLFTMEEVFTSSKPMREIVGDDAIEPKKENPRVWWGDVYSRIAMGNLCLPSTVILTRKRAEAVGDFDESMRSGEDHDYHLRACSLGPAGFLDAPAVLYRKGAEDQLTAKAYELLIAQNALRTIEAALEKDRARINLPEHVILNKIASLHAWIGREMLDKNDNSGARKHFLSSLRLRPKQPKIWGLLGLAALPPSVADNLRRSVREVRARARAH